MTTLDYGNLSSKYRDELTKSGPAFIPLSLNVRSRDCVIGIFFREGGIVMCW